MTADNTKDNPKDNPSDKPPPDTRMTTNEVARLLGCNDAWVRHLGDSGTIGSELTRLGRLYSRADVEAYKAERDLPGARRSWHSRINGTQE